MSLFFSISERHYKLITQQAIDNLPQESGGFLGGSKAIIKAVLPLHNKQEGDKTAKFGIDAEDMERAIRFFKKHNLDYFGAYHSHPNGVAYPSQQDLIAGQIVENRIKKQPGVYHYHFIIGCKKDQEPILGAFKVIKKKVKAIPIQILSNNSFSSVDIFSGQVKKKAGPKSMFDEADILSDQLHDIKQNNAKYQKLEPKSKFGASDFSTFA